MRAGRVALIVIGALVGSLAFGLLLAGGALGWAWSTGRTDDGYFTTPEVNLQTDGYAIVTPAIDLGSRPGDVFPAGDLLEVRIAARSLNGSTPFVGIAPSADVDEYLAGVEHDELVRFHGDEPILDATDGTVVPAAPTEEDFWATTNAGGTTPLLDWEPSEGDWKLVLMNSDGSSGISAVVTASSALGFVPWIAAGLSIAGLVLAAGAIALLLGAVVGRHTPTSVEPVPSRGYPVQLSGTLDDGLTSWMWLVKWFLAIPHFVVLAFLIPVSVVLTIVAGVAIVLTGAYPRAIFDFNVGVLRWVWRVTFYATGVIGTDRYPPFTLETTDYPADLRISYPPHLSRPLVLVKWLLALPHLVIIGLFTSGLIGWRQQIGEGLNMYQGTSLITLLVLIVGVTMIFTNRYPRSLFDLLMGLHRWIYRVIAYVGLMTDEYPPFRLDQGGSEPGLEPTDPTHDDSASGTYARAEH